MRNHEFGIYATSNGRVFFVGQDVEIRNDKEYKSKYGNRIYKEIEGSKKIELYAHLYKVYVKSGDYVKAGQLIGTMGNTGMTEQSLIDEWTMQEIKAENPELYKWVMSFQDNEDEILITSGMKDKALMMDELNDYLIKHLHYGLYPSDDKLMAKHAIDPYKHLLNNKRPCNTKVTGLFGADYSKIHGKPYIHKGVDFSGRKQHLIDDWKELI